ncbi:MAG: pilus assembly protein, partial [Micrococcales bacterium]|nr:pilus assembly protein [Micrococcales bacterium]
DRGSAVAEFVMVAALLVFVAMAVFQVGLALYIRNALISAASEGARYAARADSNQALGVDRTASLIRSGLSETYAHEVSARETTVGGVSVVEVTVSAPLPVMGLLGPSGSMTVSGRAFNERQVAQAEP